MVPEYIPGVRKLRVIYAGTPEFAVTPLVTLINHPYVQVVAVLTQPDRPAGRGKRLHINPIKQLALMHQLRVMQPAHIKKNPEFLKQLAELKPDLVVVTAYGLVLPHELLQLPLYGCINIHASLLPKWRGAAPVERAILAGDKLTGITMMQMDEGLDTGDILLRMHCSIEQKDTAADLYAKLSRLSIDALQQTLRQLLQHQLHPTTQNHTDAVYADKIGTAEAEINWTQSAEQIDRMIRAFNPRPVAFSYLNEQRIKIWEAKPITYAIQHASDMMQPGTLLLADHQLIVQCGARTFLALKHMQFPGKKPLPVSKILQGYPSFFQQYNQFQHR